MWSATVLILLASVGRNTVVLLAVEWRVGVLAMGGGLLGFPGLPKVSLVTSRRSPALVD